MTRTSKGRFRPALEGLDPRTLLSAVTATLGRGVLIIRREVASDPIRVEVATLTARARGGAPAGGSVMVEGVGSFPARRVRRVLILPGPSAEGVIIHRPPGSRIRFRIARPSVGPVHPLTATTQVPPAQTLIAVPGVTGSLSAFEGQIFDLVNLERGKAGLAPLAVNPKLVAAAQIQGRNMAAARLMQHDLPGFDQPTLVSRAQFAGYTNYGWLGENLAILYPDAPSFVNAWMGSKAHRDNILNPNLTEAGVGVGRDVQGGLYVSQEFGAPARA